MTHKRKRIWLVVAGVIVALAITVAFTYESLVIRFVLPDVEHVRVAEIEFRNDSVQLRLELSMRNKGFWKVDWLKTDIKIYDDTFLLMAYSNDSIQTIEKDGARVTTMYLTLPVKKIVSRIQAHNGEDSAAVRVVGSVQWTSFLGTMDSQVDIMYNLRVPIPPAVVFSKVYLQRGEEKGIYNVLCEIEISNKNPRELILDSVAYVLNGNRFGQLTGFLPHVVIAAEDSTHIEAPAVLEVPNRLGALIRIILDKDVVDYSFVLTGKLMHFTGLENSNIPLTIIATGQMELYREDREDTKTDFIHLRH